MKLQRDNGGTNYSSIDSFESKLSLSLPEEYREFLYQYNGGLTSEGSDTYLINEKQVVIDRLFGIDTKPSYDIESLLYSYADRFPKGIIPIGEDPGGNYICLNVNMGVDYGKVLFYDHEIENEDEQGRPTWDNLSLIANSFNSFTEQLH